MSPTQCALFFSLFSPPKKFTRLGGDGNIDILEFDVVLQFYVRMNSSLRRLLIASILCRFAEAACKTSVNLCKIDAIKSRY